MFSRIIIACLLAASPLSNAEAAYRPLSWIGEVCRRMVGKSTLIPVTSPRETRSLRELIALAAKTDPTSKLPELLSAYEFLENHHANVLRHSYWDQKLQWMIDQLELSVSKYDLVSAEADRHRILTLGALKRLKASRLASYREYMNAARNFSIAIDPNFEDPKNQLDLEAPALEDFKRIRDMTLTEEQVWGENFSQWTSELRGTMARNRMVAALIPMTERMSARDYILSPEGLHPLWLSTTSAVAHDANLSPAWITQHDQAHAFLRHRIEYALLFDLREADYTSSAYLREGQAHRLGYRLRIVQEIERKFQGKDREFMIEILARAYENALLPKEPERVAAHLNSYELAFHLAVMDEIFQAIINDTANPPTKAYLQDLWKQLIEILRRA